MDPYQLQMLRQEFKVLDANGDGKVDRSEMMAFLKEKHID